MKKGHLFLCLLLCLFITPLPLRGNDRGAGGQAPKIPVFATILPQAYFLERIGGNYLQVSILVGPGQSPHTYEPTPRQMAKLATARAYFRIGVPVERGVLNKLRKTNPQLIIVATQQGVPYRYLDDYDHGHEKAGQRREPPAGRSPGQKPGAVGMFPPENRAGKRGETPDPHIWMSPRLVKIQARNIHEALCRLDPAHRQEYGAGLQSFLEDLDRVDARISRALAPLRGEKMYVFHPAFGYFADAYGLTQVPVERAGKEPSARQLAALITAAKRDGVKVMFVQRQFPAKSAAAVAAAIGGAVTPIDPLARDYLANLERIAGAVEQARRGNPDAGRRRNDGSRAS